MGGIEHVQNETTQQGKKTPPKVMYGACFTHLGPHIYLNVKYLFFKVLLLHNTPLINPAVLTLVLH